MKSTINSTKTSKQIGITIVLLCAVYFNSFAQNTFPSSGNTGIGTSSPTAPLHIANTLNAGDAVFLFGNPQQNKQIIFRDRDRATFLYGTDISQLKLGTSGNEHKIMSVQANSNNITFWPTVSLNSSSNIILNPSTNVGIGSSTPGYKLDVNGAVNATDFLINGSSLASLNSLWLTTTGGVYYNGGNVGIGTTVPSAPFEIGTTTSSGGTIFKFGNPQQNSQIIFRDRSNATFLYGVQPGQLAIGHSGSEHKIMDIQANSYNITMYPTLSVNTPTDILLNAGQNVGIGTSNPQYKLDVGGAINATQLSVNGTPISNVWNVSGNNAHYTTGNVGIGTSNPTQPLDVNGNANIVGNINIGGGLNIAGPIQSTGTLSASCVSTACLNISGTFTSTNVTTGLLSASRIVAADSSGEMHIGDSSFVINSHYNFMYYTGGEKAVTGNAFARGMKIGSTKLQQIVFGPKPQFKVANGYENDIAYAPNSTVIGQRVGTAAGAINSIVIGNGTGSAPLVNVTPNTLWAGFNSDKPTFVITSANGLGTTGNVGIGTTTPYKALTVNGDVSFANYNISGGGNSGNGFSGFEILGNNQTPTRRGISLTPDPNGDLNFFINSNQNPSGFNFKNGNGGATLFTIQNNGKVGIGINPADFNNGTGINYQLYVKGGILTEAVTVAVKGTSDWNDIVFESSYKLKSLTEVADYVKLHKHLEGIPSAQEVVKNGYDIAKMDAKLLGKVEELTLYLIQMKDELNALKQENAALKAIIKK